MNYCLHVSCVPVFLLERKSYFFRKEHHNQFKFKDSSGKYIHISEELLFNNLAMFHTTLLQSIHTLQWNKDQLFNDMDFEIAFYEICSFIRQFENVSRLSQIILN